MFCGCAAKLYVFLCSLANALESHRHRFHKGSSNRRLLRPGLHAAGEPSRTAAVPTGRHRLAHAGRRKRAAQAGRIVYSAAPNAERRSRKPREHSRRR
jgi:hypothetical protein